MIRAILPTDSTHVVQPFLAFSVRPEDAMAGIRTEERALSEVILFIWADITCCHGFSAHLTNGE